MGLKRRNLTRIAFSFLALCLVSLVLFRSGDSAAEERSLSKFVFSAKSSKPSAKKLAFATFLSTRADDDKEDIYFDAARVLGYQLTYAPETRSQENIPFVVVVTANVTQRKRDRLAKDGYRVVVMDTISIRKQEDEPTEGVAYRWIDQYTKLKLWTLTEYDRILYIDSDMLITKPLDGVFNITAAPIKNRLRVVEDKPDEAPLPQDYLIAGVTDAGGWHDVPAPDSNNFNGGFFLMKPDLKMYDHYLSVLRVPEKFDNGFMEQDLLNYVHRLDGNLPWSRLEASKWNANWPSMKEYEYGTASLHEKWWNTGDCELQKKWAQVKGQMEGFWLGREGRF